MADLKKIELDIIAKAEAMAKILSRGNDCEIRKDVNGIKVVEVKKSVVR